MVELRWVPDAAELSDGNLFPSRKLQYRTADFIIDDESGALRTRNSYGDTWRWTEWQDVPVVEDSNAEREKGDE